MIRIRQINNLVIYYDDDTCKYIIKRYVDKVIVAEFNKLSEAKRFCEVNHGDKQQVST